MGKEKNASFSLLLRELFNLNIYKRSQGRIARQVTFAAFLIGGDVGFAPRGGARNRPRTPINGC